MDFLDQLLSIPRIIGTPRVSPDGKYIAFNWANVNENVDVFVVPVDGAEPPVPLTNTRQATILRSWAPDSQSVIVAEDTDRNERYTLYRVDLETKERTAITEENPSFFLRGGEISSKTSELFFAANYDFNTNKTIEATWIWKQDLETGARELVTTTERPLFLVPQLNSTGTHLLFTNSTTSSPSGRQIWLTDLKDNSSKEILSFGEKAKCSGSWLPNGKDIVFTTDDLGYIRVGVFNIETEKISWIAEDAKQLVSSARASQFGDKLIIYHEEVGRLKSSVYNLQTAEWNRVKAEKGTIEVLTLLPDDSLLAITYSSTQPADLIRIDTTGHSTSLTKVWEHTSLTADQLTPAIDHFWTSTDGTKIHGWLYKSKIPTQRLIIYVHGGPTAHSEDAINAQIQYFVHRGFNVIDPNYRGSTGYGVEFRDLIKKDGWGGLEQDDILAAAESLLFDQTTKMGSIGITGTSYGGYSSWYAITHNPKEMIKAAAPICGMTDLVVDYETTRPDLRSYSEEMLGGSPDTVPKVYYERSPINFIHNIEGELLIVQGAQDPNVSPENLRAVQEKLDEHGKKYEVKVFDDEGHGILKPKNQKVLYRLLADFFEKHL